MVKYNPKNERLKRRYFTFLKQAKGRDDTTIDGVASALHRFEQHTRFKDFKTFRAEQAISFKTNLAERVISRDGKPLSKSTLHHTANALKAFFQWLSAEPGHRSCITYSHADYFGISDKDARIATAKRERPVPSLEQIHHALNQMPYSNEVEMRDRAIVAFVLLTGMRDGAIASMRLGLVDLAEGAVFQDARLVKTKFAKSFTSSFFPVGGQALEVVTNWIEFLVKSKLFGPDDPLFPSAKIINGPNLLFINAGLTRKRWTNAGPIRKIFRRAFLDAGFAPFNPHSIRKTLVQLMMKICRTPEQIQAWSQNLGHESPATTYASYGQLDDRQRKRVMGTISIPTTETIQVNERRKQLLKELSALD